MTGVGSTLIGAGHAVPDGRVTNADLEARFELEPGWIERRTGILERRYAAPDQALSDLAVAAGEMALEGCGLARDDVGLLVLATSTPDHVLPPTAPLVAHRLGLTRSGAIDMAGACAGFIYALSFADSFVRQNGRSAIVIGANILSRRTNPDDRSSSILFGDGAGAVVLSPVPDENRGVVGVSLQSDGSAYDLIKVPAGGTRQPFDNTLDATDLTMQLPDGKAVFSRAVTMMADAATAAVTAAGSHISDVDIWIPHQANQRIMVAVSERLGIEANRMRSSVAKYANSSAATIPLTLSETSVLADCQPGTTILIAAAGAGMTGGAIVYRT
jgi:3-oxoacyl-[acyl-carrier-protein] synthase III